MHVLTKVFIVLNSILAVLLVPLVVVYAHNENNFKAQLKSAKAEAQSYAASLDSTSKTATARDAIQEVAKERLRGEISVKIGDLNDATREIEELRDSLAARSTDEAARAQDIQRLAAGYTTATKMLDNLINESSGLRKEALGAQKESLRLTQDLRDAERQLEVIDGARRRLEEQLTDLRGENNTALRTIQRYRQAYPGMDRAVAALDSTNNVTENLSGSVVNVRESDVATYVEINLGAKDGVEEGWVLIIQDGDNYITDLKITKVDIDTSIGIVTNADRFNVGIGNRVRAIKGVG